MTGVIDENWSTGTWCESGTGHGCWMLNETGIWSVIWNGIAYSMRRTAGISICIGNECLKLIVTAILHESQTLIGMRMIAGKSIVTGICLLLLFVTSSLCLPVVQKSGHDHEHEHGSGHVLLDDDSGCDWF